MSDENIKHLSNKQRERNGGSVRDAIKRAKQHIRNVSVDDLEEPEGFASGDMKKFLMNPDEYEKEDDDERKDEK